MTNPRDWPDVVWLANPRGNDAWQYFDASTVEYVGNPPPYVKNGVPESTVNELVEALEDAACPDCGDADSHCQGWCKTRDAALARHRERSKG